MTGQVARETTAAPRPQRELAEPQVADTRYEDGERERIDIPAFLRRQAN